MTEYKEEAKNFILSLELPMLADVLLKTLDDCKRFFSSYYGRNRFKIDDLLDYRDDLLKTQPVPLSVFLDGCKGDIKISFERTFLQNFTVTDIPFILKSLEKRRWSLEDLYHKFHEDTNVNILQSV